MPPAKLVVAQGNGPIGRMNEDREEVEDDLSQMPRVHGGGMAA